MKLDFENVKGALKLWLMTVSATYLVKRLIKGKQMEILDQKLGTDGEVKVDQVAGVLSVEADLNTPILQGKLILGLQESAIFDALEAKYPNAWVVAALEMLKKAISLFA